MSTVTPPARIAEISEFPVTSLPIAHHARVECRGVLAEWVEVTVATEGQPTFVYFGAGRCRGDVLEQNRPFAGRLATVTAARVLSVACWPVSEQFRWGAVEQGLTAYRWLLGEGCDLESTAFAAGPTDAELVTDILRAARARSIPLPALGIRFAPDLG